MTSLPPPTPTALERATEFLHSIGVTDPEAPYRLAILIISTEEAAFVRGLRYPQQDPIYIEPPEN